MRKKRKLALFLCFLVLIGGGLTYWLRPTEPHGASDAFQGYIEGEILYIGPVEGERLAQINVSAGQMVQVGQPLFSLLTQVMDEQRREILARLSQAMAQLSNLQAAHQRPEEIAVLEAAHTRAEVALALSRKEYDRQKTLVSNGVGAKNLLDQTEAAMNRDAASLNESERQIAVAKLSGRTQDVAAAQAQVEALQSQLQQIELRLKRQTVEAPAAGVVQEIFFRSGEMIIAGQPVLSLLPPENRKIRFYVPEPLFARFSIGQTISVSCDGCQKDVIAHISFISSQSEYTPPIIFSEEERSKQVFRIEARFDSGGANLPLGLPVTVRIKRDPTP